MSSRLCRELCWYAMMLYFLTPFSMEKTTKLLKKLGQTKFTQLPSTLHVLLAFNKTLQFMLVLGVGDNKSKNLTPNIAYLSVPFLGSNETSVIYVYNTLHFMFISFSVQFIYYKISFFIHFHLQDKLMVNCPNVNNLLLVFRCVNVFWNEMKNKWDWHILIYWCVVYCNIQSQI